MGAEELLCGKQPQNPRQIALAISCAFAMALLRAMSPFPPAALDCLRAFTAAARRPLLFEKQHKMAGGLFGPRDFPLSMANGVWGCFCESVNRRSGHQAANLVRAALAEMGGGRASSDPKVEFNRARRIVLCYLPCDILMSFYSWS